MPSISLFIPFSRSHGLLLRLVAILTLRPDRDHPVIRKQPELPDYLRKDVGLPPEVVRPPPQQYRFPF